MAKRIRWRANCEQTKASILTNSSAPKARAIAAALFVIAGLLFFCRDALGQAAAKQEAAKDNQEGNQEGKVDAAKGKKVDAAKGKKVIKLGEIHVEGRIQKPQAFYIIQRSNLNFEGLELKESLLPKIVKAVEKEPF